ncbi:MAG TPA: hypothetical protein VGO22_02000 [Pseudorhizobium sp.]|nr:hypothetical protein [Pseudorhizobium sp.]
MSGLETAIRNALEKSDRGNPAIRAQIYQSARQALQSGLSKQGVTDVQVIATQRQRLEAKIREIEEEEQRSQPTAPTPATPQVRAPAPEAHEPRNVRQQPPAGAASAEAFALGGATRDEWHSADRTEAGDPSSLGALGADRSDAAPGKMSQDVLGETRLDGASPGVRAKGRRRRSADPSALTDSMKRSRSPRRRRSLMPVLAAWLVFLALFAAAAWWAYSSGLVRQSMEQAIEAANRSSLNQQNGQGLGPQVGFSEDWLLVFDGSDAGAVEASGAAQLEPADTASGSAARLSLVAGAEGEIVVAVPVDILRQLAGRTSTIALTVQAAADAAVEFAVSCDFGSLGTCPRHRFTAHQEKAEALFRVTFAETSAADASGRLLLTTSSAAGSSEILLHAVRILPGQ